MNIEDLSKSAVRLANRAGSAVGLSEKELRTVVGGISGINRPIQVGIGQEPVTPEQCAIHLYYPQDGTA